MTAGPRLGLLARSAVVRYGAALLVVSAAVVLALPLRPVMDASVVLLMAIMVTAWFWGLWPAVAASVAATLAVDYVFTPPLYTLTLDIAHIPRLILFTVVAAIFTSVSITRRRAEQILQRGRDVLDAQVRARTADLTRANQRLAMQYGATRALAASDAFDPALAEVMQIIAATMNWDAGALWNFDRADQVLHRVSTWRAPGVAGGAPDHPHVTFRPGEGVPGQVWQSGEAQWITDVTKHASFVRSADAAVAGFHTAMAFPILVGNEATGVIEFFSCSIRRPDPEELDALSAIGSQIGQVIERRRAEDARREQAALLDLTHDTVFVRDMNDVIRYWNRGAEQLYGWTSQEAVGQVTHRLTRTILPAPLERIHAELLATGRWEGELRHTRRDGAEVIVASRWSLQRDPNGTPIAVLETNNDITERKRAEDALRDSERRYRHIFHATSVSIWEEDFSRIKAAIDGLKQRGVRDFRTYVHENPAFVEAAIALVRIVDVNDATLKMFGAPSKQELVGSLATIFTAETRDVFAGELIAIAEGQASFEGETVLKKWNGDRLVALFSVSFPPPDAAFDAVLVSIMDITARKRAEQELEELAARLIHAQEQERSRIGRELHDHISQMLGVLTIRMDQLRADERTPPSVASTLEELRRSTAELTTDIHDLSHRLHSSTLDYLGLVPAMQRLVTDFSNRHRIGIAFTHSGLPSPLPSDVALALFRVAEESLANIAKHSGATLARVDVRGSSAGIALTIEDSGNGFEPDTLARGAGLGFVSMRERLRALRGTLHIDSTRGRGTRISVSIPAESVARDAAAGTDVETPMGESLAARSGN